MNILIKIKHHLDMFFFPFLTCYGFETKFLGINLNLFCKTVVALIWLTSIISLCFLIYELSKRNGEVKEQNKTIIDFTLSFFLITTILFMILILLNSYIIYVFSEANGLTRYSKGLFGLGFFIFFISYCIKMNAYYNPSIKKVDEKEDTTEEKENIKYIYNKDKNLGTLKFFGFLLAFLCLFFIFNFPFFPLIKKWKGYRNFISDFFQLNISTESNKNFGGSYLSLGPTGGGCIII
jgi:uncharacterized membrane protein